MDIDNGYTTAKEFFDKKLQELEEKLEKAEGVIRFYADKENWNETKDGRYKTEGIFFISRDMPFLQVENGMKAREYFEGKE